MTARLVRLAVVVVWLVALAFQVERFDVSDAWVGGFVTGVWTAGVLLILTGR